MNKRLFSIALTFMLVLSSFIPCHAIASTYHEGEIEEYIVRQMAAANIPGMAVSIVTSQKEVYSAAFGDIPETTSDMELGGVSKSFTALAVMQLVENGKISLDDTVSKYISDTDIPDITVRELLTETSGLEPDCNIDSARITENRGKVAEAAVNYNLLGKIIEAAASETYAAYVKQNILKPLQMDSSYVLADGRLSEEGYVYGHSNYFGMPVKIEKTFEEDEWQKASACGVVSDVKDMGKYLQMYLAAGGEIISYKSLETIMKDGNMCKDSVFGTKATYGMGWTVTELNGEEVFYCDGSSDRYTAAAFIIPARDIGVVIMANSADAISGDKIFDTIEAGIIKLITGESAKGVSSNENFVSHMTADVVYLVLAILALLPIFMIEAWIRWTKERFSVLRLVFDIIIHAIIPTILIFVPGYLGVSWGFMRHILPDAYYVMIAVIGIFYLGGIIKIISRLIIGDRSDYQDLTEGYDEPGNDSENEKKEEVVEEETEKMVYAASEEEDIQQLEEKEVVTIEAETQKTEESTVEEETICITEFVESENLADKVKEEKKTQKSKPENRKNTTAEREKKSQTIEKHRPERKSSVDSKEDKNRKDTYKRKLSSDEAKRSVNTHRNIDRKLSETDRARPKREQAAGNNRSNTPKRDNRERTLVNGNREQAHRNSNVNRPRNNVTHKTSNVSKTNVTKNNVRKANPNKKNSEEE